MNELEGHDGDTRPLSPFRVRWNRVVTWWVARVAAEPRPFTELRRRLIATNLLATVVALLIFSVAIFFLESNLELAQIDTQLSREATGQAIRGLPTTSAPQTDAREIAYDPTSANYFSIVVSRAGLVVQDDDQAQRYGLPDWTSAGPVRTGALPQNYATVRRDGIEFRLFTTPIIEKGSVVGVVQSGMSLGSYNQQLVDLQRGLLALDLLILILSFASSVYLTNRALKPARDAFQRQRQFSAGASHELRTPLALIRSLAELIADHRCAPGADVTLAGSDQATAAAGESLESQESVRDDAQEIIQEVGYMARLVDDLLLLARDEHDRRALNWVTVDVRRVLQGVVSVVTPLAARRDIAFSSELEGRADGRSAALVEGDPDRLRELALILIENALRYTPPGGSVALGLSVTRAAAIRGERHGHITLTVRDTGVGIAQADQPHVFDPFYRSTSSSLRRAQMPKDESASGSGLGLALAHWIVEAHQGEISLTSAPNHGTTFIVELPLAVHTRPTNPPNHLTPRLIRSN